MTKNIFKHALIGAGVTTTWIIIVVSVISNAERIFGAQEPEDNLLIPVAMLLLFVVSAAITSMGVFGRPIMWYLDGKKKEALRLLATTLGLLIAFGLIIVSIIL